MPENPASPAATSGLTIVGVVLAQSVVAGLLIGLFYAAGMFTGTVDNGLDPMIDTAEFDP